MKLAELMNGVKPDPKYTGFVTNDDWVLALDLSPNGETKTEPKDYHVVQMGIEGLDAQLNPITQDKTYIRAGQSSQKTGTQRSFKVGGDRYIGDPVQDYMFSHDIAYGTGNKVITNYVYFNILTGKGEKGQVSIIVNSAGSGNAGESSGIDVELKKVGAMPVEYEWESDNTSAESGTENTEQTTDDPEAGTETT